MTEQLEDELRSLFHEDALEAPALGNLSADVRRLRRRRRRMQFAWGGAGTAVAASVPLAAVLLGGGQAVEESSLEELTARPPAISGQGALADSGFMLCAESYDAGDPVSARAFAFDGTVAAIGPAISNREGLDSGLVGVRFEVNEWFAGGATETVVVDLTQPDLSGLDELPPAYGLRTRLLVSGEPRWGGAPLEDPIAWGCGFTRYYDDATAASWRADFER